jgi:beta-xylosidase
MGVIREDNTPKPAARILAEHSCELGVCQWFEFEDHRLDAAVRWLKEIGIKQLRTGLSWSDNARPGREAWFDKQMKALEDFDVTVTFCFTPEDEGVAYTSPPRRPEKFAEFCAAMVRRYAC